MSAIDQIPVKDLLNNLAADGVRLYADGADLKFQAVHPIDDETRKVLKKRKPEIIEALSKEHSPLDRLTDAEKEAFEQYVEIMTSSKFNLSMEQAEQEAGRLVLKAKQSLQARQATKDYKRDGFIKIYSTVLTRAVYLARNEGAAKRVPDKSLSVFLESDVEAAKGLSQEEIKVLLEARILLGGPITVEDYSEPSPKRPMDGKTIAKTFYGK